MNKPNSQINYVAEITDTKLTKTISGSDGAGNYLIPFEEYLNFCEYYKDQIQDASDVSIYRYVDFLNIKPQGYNPTGKISISNLNAMQIHSFCYIVGVDRFIEITTVHPDLSKFLEKAVHSCKSDFEPIHEIMRLDTLHSIFTRLTSLGLTFRFVDGSFTDGQLLKGGKVVHDYNAMLSWILSQLKFIFKLSVTPRSFVASLFNGTSCDMSVVNKVIEDYEKVGSRLHSANRRGGVQIVDLVNFVCTWSVEITPPKIVGMKEGSKARCVLSGNKLHRKRNGSKVFNYACPYLVDTDFDSKSIDSKIPSAPLKTDEKGPDKNDQ